MDTVAGPESTRSRAVAGAVPGLLLALSLNGFFLYLGALDLAGVEPRAALTGPYYLLVGTGLSAVVLRGRRRLVARLHEGGTLVRVWAAAAAALAAWFLVTATLRSDGELARDAAILLVLAGIPSALATLTFDRQDIDWLVRGLVATGVAYAIVSTGALVTLDEAAARFSPIDELDPISAAKIAALGAVACLLLRPRTRRGRVLQGTAVALLVATSILPAGRGPLVALAVALAVAVLVAPRLLRITATAVAAGGVVGVLATGYAGSSYYLRIDVPVFDDAAPPTGPDFTGERPSQTPDEQEPISSAGIRRYLLEKAIRAVPDAPLLGHGVGSLEDDSPDTLRMVSAGRLDPDRTRTHPHNVLVEAAYSLGLLGLVPLLVCVGAAAVALVRAGRRARDSLGTLFAAGFAAAAAVNSSLSGELGMDAYVWVALALPVALYLARREATVSSR